MVSIIIVNYKVQKEIIACIKSIISSKPRNKFEIIVIDNDIETSLEKDVKKLSKLVRYHKNESNIGFGAANNIGAKLAKGDYLFILNPDTIIYKNTIDTLLAFLKNHKDVGIVAPLLIGSNGKPYQQGATTLTPQKAVIVLSFLNKLFPNNPISQNYYLKKWNMKSDKEVDVCPGTAFMISKKLYNEVRGFDTRFFLYFEEFDLCKRIRDMKLKIFITHKAMVKHAWGLSTRQKPDIQKIFEESKLYYFKKHFGLLQAIFVTYFTKISKYNIFVGCIAIFGAFLALNKLDQTMPFIGDHGWFYLSARDLLINHQFPLVGIASSHPWLHQGAFWTYILAVSLSIFQFNPIAGAYASITFHILTILSMYSIGKGFFSRKIGILAAILYATSPLIIFSARTPYHSSIIPFFSLWYFYFMVKWISGNKKFLPLVIGSLAVLYNFQIFTALFSAVFGLVFIFGLITRKQRLLLSLTIKNILVSFIFYLIPMAPMLVYDFNHGFPQTFGFLMWIGYRILLFFGYPSLHPFTEPIIIQNPFNFLLDNLQRIYFLPSLILSTSIFLISIAFVGYKIITIKKDKNKLANLLLILIVFICFGGIIFTGTNSYAYLPLLYPSLIFIISIGLSNFFLFKKLYILVIVIACIVMGNIYSLMQNNYFTASGKTFDKKIALMNNIVKDSAGEKFNLIEKNKAVNYIDHYRYLTWWLGNEPSNKKESLVYFTLETNDTIYVTSNKGKIK